MHQINSNLTSQKKKDAWPIELHMNFHFTSIIKFNVTKFLIISIIKQSSEYLFVRCMTIDQLMGFIKMLEHIYSG